MATASMPQAIAHYAARVDVVLEQRTRLRGPQPAIDLFGELPPGHQMLQADTRAPLDENLAVLASYIEADDVVIDVGGGAGRMSLPLAPRCREIVNVEPSPGMAAAFLANAARSGVTNVRHVASGWPSREPPIGTVALVCHVTYLTREVWPFMEQLEQAGKRRVLLLVGAPPPPALHRELFRALYDEEEQSVPGHGELANVLWEQGRLPDVIVLPRVRTAAILASPSRATAIRTAMERFTQEQWAGWPRGAELESRFHRLLETRFDEFFQHTDGMFVPRWLPPSREVLLTWQP